MNVVYGVLTDELGLAHNGRACWATPSGEVRRDQPARLIVDREHDGVAVGEVIDLQLRHGNLWAIAHIHDDITPTVNVKVGNEIVSVDVPMFWSASRWSTEDYEDVVFHSVALTTRPARVHSRPVRFLPGMLDNRQAHNRWDVDRDTRAMLERAAHHHLDRRIRGRDEPLLVSTSPTAGKLYERTDTVTALMHNEDLGWDRPPGKLRHSVPFKGVLRVS